MSINTKFEQAGFWERVKAFGLDYVLILFYLIAITLVIFLLNSLFHINGLMFSERVRAQFFAFLLVTLPVTLYFSINESSKQQATWGKKRLSLQVVDANGGRISPGRAFTRTLLKFIPWELSFSPQANSIWISLGFGSVYVLIGLNIVSLLRTKSHQTVYDLLTGTYVIKQNL
ncbi:MAG TPA: RDD family protein [Anaerolineales bacterium]|nr:RDD family protein [Anaerolineales bacterium]